VYVNELDIILPVLFADVNIKNYATSGLYPDKNQINLFLNIYTISISSTTTLET